MRRKRRAKKKIPNPKGMLRDVAYYEDDGGEVEQKGREERDLKTQGVPAQVAQPQRGEVGEEGSETHKGEQER